jgi:hypothetical protein
VSDLAKRLDHDRPNLRLHGRRCIGRDCRSRLARCRQEFCPNRDARRFPFFLTRLQPDELSLQLSEFQPLPLDVEAKRLGPRVLELARLRRFSAGATAQPFQRATSAVIDVEHASGKDALRDHLAHSAIGAKEMRRDLAVTGCDFAIAHALRLNAKKVEDRPEAADPEPGTQ